MTQDILIQYTMVGQLLTDTGPNALQSVYWDVYNTPDYIGQYSGYQGALQNIEIAAVQTIEAPSQVVVPTSPALGDLGGNYPNPIVIGLQGNPIQTGVLGPSSDGYILTFNADGYWTAEQPASGFIAAGDLSGSSTNQIVIGIQSVAVSASAPSSGQVLTASSSSAAHWATIPASSAAATSGLSNNRPSATGSGSLYFCTDIPVVYLDNSATSTWQQFASEYLLSPAPIGSYTTVGNLAIHQRGDSIYAATTHNSDVGGCSVAVVPGSLSNTATWTVNLVATGYLFLDQQYPMMGVCVSNGTTINSSQTWALLMILNGSSGSGIHGINSILGNGNRNNVYNEVLTYPTYLLSGTGRLHFRLLNDGLNLHMQCSPDGFLFQDWVTITCPTGLTDYGFFLGTEDGSTNSYGQAIVYENTLGSISAAQQTVSAATGNGVAVQITVGSTAGYLAGDVVAVRGMVGNTALNQGTGNFTGASGRIVHSIDSATQISFNETGNGTYTSGGIITLLSR